MFRFGLPLLLLAALVASCASLSQEQCQYSDWEILGREDGSKGRTIGRFQNYVEDCGRYGIRPDSAAYNRGRDQGLEEFCTPVGVYTNGLRSRGSAALCGNAPDLVRIHRAAWEYNETRMELDRVRNEYDQIYADRRAIRREIDKIRRRLRSDDLSDERRDELERDLRRCYDNLDDYERDADRLRYRLRDLEREFEQQTLELALVEAEFGLRSRRY